MLAKYHKTHLYHVYPGSNYGPGAPMCAGDGCWPPADSDPQTFVTSFGVRFGMHICFDLLFRTPAAALALDDPRHVTDFTFSTLWENNAGVPMAFATAIQQAWSRGVGVNLLASNGGRGFGGTGSGIYSRGETLAAAWEPFNEADEALVLARVPILSAPRPNVVDAGAAIATKRGPPPQWPAAHAAKDIDLSPPVLRIFTLGGDLNASGRISVTTPGGFSCSFSYVLAASAPPAPAVRYALYAVNGSLLCGVLPARACGLYRLPSHVDVARAFPFVNCSEPSGWYTSVYAGELGNASGVRAQLRAPGPLFASWSLRGDFVKGDLVLPMADGEDGAPLNASALQITEKGRAVAVAAMGARPLWQAMLLTNTRPGLL